MGQRRERVYVYVYALKSMLKINLKISSRVLGKIFNLSLSGPGVRQQMIFKKKIMECKVRPHSHPA